MSAYQKFQTYPPRISWSVVELQGDKSYFRIFDKLETERPYSIQLQHLQGKRESSKHVRLESSGLSLDMDLDRLTSLSTGPLE